MESKNIDKDIEHHGNLVNDNLINDNLINDNLVNDNLANGNLADDINLANDTIIDMMDKVSEQPQQKIRLRALPSGEILNKLSQQNYEKSQNRSGRYTDRYDNGMLTRTNSVTRLKTIRRRGVEYRVPTPRQISTIHDDSDDEELDNMMEDLYHDSLRLSTSASRTSSILKCLYILSTFFTIIAGVGVGILTLFGGGQTSCSNTNITNGIAATGTQYSIPIIIAACLGFLISAVESLVSVFSIQKRGVLLRDISNRLRKTSRQIKMLQHSDMTTSEKFKSIENLYAKIDELDLNIFDNTITMSAISKDSNPISDNEKSDKRKPPKTNRSDDYSAKRTPKLFRSSD